MAEKTDRKYPTDSGDVMQTARDRFDRCVNFERLNRRDALSDLEFRVGQQWPNDIRLEREAALRPVITINRMPQFIRQVTGDIRINRPAIRVRPVDDVADVETAEVLTGLVRHIEHVSTAHIAYTTAADGAAACGIGHFRIVLDYSDDDTFDVDIKIRRILNSFAVYFDPDAEELTRQDAKYCFVLADYPLDEYKRTWPDSNLAEWDAAEIATRDYMTEWWDKEVIRVAEYWCRKEEKKTIYLLEDGRVVDELPEGVKAVDKREVVSSKVVQYLMNGDQILEGPTEWVGRYIPIIPVIGEEVHVGDKVVRHGVIRYAKDPQMLYNYWRTTAAETIALAPKSPWVGTHAQFEGNEATWAEANRSNVSVLAYTPDGEAPPPARDRPADVPMAVVNEAGIAAEDMNAVTGIYPSALGARSNETSGTAIRARQGESDVGTFVYVDNLAIAIAHGGKIIVDLIPHVYSEEKQVRILGEDGTESFAKINEEAKDEETGLNTIKVDLARGKYDVAVTTGPSFTTRRQESAEAMMQFVSAAPQTAAAVMDLIAKNLDWPGADQFADRLKRMIPSGLDDDLDDERRERETKERQNQPPQPPPPPDPRAIKAEADAQESLADAAKKQAETAGIELENAAKQIELADSLGAMQGVIKQAVIEAVLATIGEIRAANAPPPPLIPGGAGGIPPQSGPV